MPSDLLRRQAAVEKTRAKYRGKSIDWKSIDCIHMLRSHLVAMGHRGLPKIPFYRSPTGALRALRETGFADLEALIDSLLPRIVPAQRLLADIVLMRGDENFDAVTISVGRKVMGWHSEAAELVMMTPHEIKAAWRVGRL